MVQRIMASGGLGLRASRIPLAGGEWVVIPEASSTWSLPFGLRELMVQSHLRRLLKKSDAFVDCGANVGYYSFVASRFKGIQKILSIEPLDDAARFLEMIKSLNGLDRLEILQIAASDHDGLASFSTSEKKFFEMGRVLEKSVPAESGDEKVEVKCQTLESILGAVDPSLNRICLKVDVEGHERQVLSSCRQETLRKRIAAALVEVHLYKFERPEEELTQICERLSVIGTPRFILPPEQYPRALRFGMRLLGFYPSSRMTLDKAIRRMRIGSLSEVHVMVERGAGCAF